MAAHRFGNANGESLEVELNDIMASNVRHAAALCAAACQARVEEARREERARLRSEAGQQAAPGAGCGPPAWEEVVWTRGFFDEKLKACGSGQSRQPSKGSCDVVDAAALAARSPDAEHCEFAQILRNAFSIRDAMHAALANAANASDIGREQKVRTCSIKSIVGKVHALWQEKWLEDSDEEGPSVKSSDQARNWKSASEKPASRRASVAAPRRPSALMSDRVAARRQSGEKNQLGDLPGAIQALQEPAGFGALKPNASRQHKPRLSCPPAMADAMRGAALPERAFTPSLDRIDDVPAESNLASSPQLSPALARSAALPAPASASRLPASPATVPAPRTPGRSGLSEPPTDLGKTLAELTALLQDAHIIGPSSPGAGAGAGTGQT